MKNDQHATDRLQKIKDGIALRSGYNSFKESLKDNSLKRSTVIAEALEKIIDEIAKTYATELLKNFSKKN